MSNLIPIESVNPIILFTEKGLDDLLAQIEAETKTLEADVSSDKGRKEIKSMAYKVILSKGVIDRAGADLVAEWKEKAKVVDASRRKARIFLDDLSATVRKPLTEFEEAEAQRIAAEQLAVKIAADYDEAVAMNALIDRELEIARKEAEIKAKEEQALAEENSQQQAIAAAERQKAIEAQAAKKAQQEAAAAIERERERAAQAERDKAAAIEQAERNRVAALQQAERDKASAIEQERKRQAEQDAAREAARLRQEQEAAEIERKRQADVNHRRTVNNSALLALKQNGITEEIAKQVITLVFTNKIPGIRMVY